MSDTTPGLCGKCGGAMEMGTIRDSGRIAGVAAWVPKAPPPSKFWTLLGADGAQPIRARCCTVCGFLELSVDRPKAPVP